MAMTLMFETQYLRPPRLSLLQQVLALSSASEDLPWCCFNVRRVKTWRQLGFRRRSSVKATFGGKGGYCLSRTRSSVKAAARHLGPRLRACHHVSLSFSTSAVVRVYWLGVACLSRPQRGVRLRSLAAPRHQSVGALSVPPCARYGRLDGSRQGPGLAHDNAIALW